LKSIFTFIKTHALLLFGAVWLIAGYTFYDIKIAQPKMAFMGVPQVERDGLDYWTRNFRNEGFMLGYSEWMGLPLWVTYKVEPEPEDMQRHKRPSRFDADWRSIRRMSHDDYTRSGFDRGHMAPNYLISTRYGRAAQLGTFKMTNIVPQKPKLNQKVWRVLEELVADGLSQQEGVFWVATGPIMGDKKERIGSLGPVIPKAFYKILVKPSKDGTVEKMLAFIMPQDVKGRESVTRFVTTVDEVEKQTGIDFFADLPDDIENQLEASNNSNAWNLKALLKQQRQKK